MMSLIPPIGKNCMWRGINNGIKSALIFIDGNLFSLTSECKWPKVRYCLNEKFKTMLDQNQIMFVFKRNDFELTSLEYCEGSHISG